MAKEGVLNKKYEGTLVGDGLKFAVLRRALLRPLAYTPELFERPWPCCPSVR